MLEEAKRGLEIAKNTQKAEQTTLAELKTKKIDEEKKLQSVTADFEDKQLSFLSDVIALESKIDIIARLPSKMSAD